VAKDRAYKQRHRACPAILRKFFASEAPYVRTCGTKQIANQGDAMVQILDPRKVSPCGFDIRGGGMNDNLRSSADSLFSDASARVKSRTTHLFTPRVIG
jgi:hypothetical protein